MNVHEHQAKDLLRPYGLLMPPGAVAGSPDEAEAAARTLGGAFWFVKAQVHAGGRAKAGGIRSARSAEEVRDAAAQLLGSNLVTAQTGPDGQMVRQVYVEQGVEAAREIFVALLVDRSSGRVTIMASPEGGVEIEELATRAPHKILKLAIDPVDGLARSRVRQLATDLGLENKEAEAAAEVFSCLFEAFLGLDASLIEVNPLVITKNREVVVLDLKLSLDRNALFRHPQLAALRDQADEDPSELEAARHELNYVKMSGDIGCMVNGAGLAMATLDIIKQHGGEPADFMDIRPVATRDQVAAGLRMILSNERVKALLVNIFGGGIMRCDLVAEAIIAVAKERPVSVPLVIRFAGTNADFGKKLMLNCGLGVAFADNLADAAEQAVRTARKEAV